jgi:hypothetical protein
MSVQEYIVREQDGLWQVWHGDRLVGVQPTQMAALSVAETLAHAAAVRGEPAKILVGDLDGSPIEYWAAGPWSRPAAEPA